MHASPSRVTITLSDQYFDTSRVIRAVLGILDGTWKPKAQITGVIFMERILLFAEKWNCALLLDYTLQSLFNFLDIDIQTDQEGQSFIRIFIIGAKHNLLPLCKAAITSAPLLKWKELHPFIKLPANTDPDQWILDPTGWPSELAADTPSLYLWALRRAIKSYDSDNSYIADQLREIAFPFEGLVKGHGNGLYQTNSMRHSLYIQVSKGSTAEDVLLGVKCRWRDWRND